MWLRDRLVSVIGLRTSRERVSSRPPDEGLQPGDKAGIFAVLARTDDEVLMGADDRHLNFRASVLVNRGPARSSVVLSTVVHYNNLQGRAYFFVVRPFHKVIVTSILREVACRLRSKR